MNKFNYYRAPFIIPLLIVLFFSCDFIPMEKVEYVDTVYHDVNLYMNYPADKQIITDSTPSFMWDCSGVQSEFRFQLSIDNNFSESAIIADSEINALEYTILKQLVNGQMYYWRLKMKQNGKWLDWYNTFCFTFEIPVINGLSPGIPAANQQDFFIQDTEPLLSWNASANASEYHIQLSTSEDFQNIFAEENSLVVHQYQTTALILGDCYWRVRYLNSESIMSDWSDTFYFNVDLLRPQIVAPIIGSDYYDTSPLLEWLDNNEIQAFHLQLNSVNNFSAANLVDLDSLTLEAYQLPAMPAGEYFWRVRSKDLSSVWSEWSQVASFTSLIDIPELSSPADVSTGSDSTPLLQWNSARDATNYHIMINNQSDFTGINAVNDNTIVNEEYQVSSGLDMDTWYWRVRVINSDGFSGAWSSVFSFTVDIAAPANLLPANGSSLNDTTPAFSWDPDPDASVYQIQVNDQSDLSGTVIADDNAVSGSSFEPSNAAVGTFYWRVRKCNTDGIWGKWSSVLNYSTYIDVPVLLTPADNSETVDTTPLLNWEELSSAASFDIQVDDSPSFSAPLIAEASVASSSFEVPVAQTGTFYWRVRVVNNDGLTGSWSNAFDYTAVVNVPTLVAPSGIGTTWDLTPQYEWTNEQGAAAYQLQVNRASAFNGEFIIDDSTITGSPLESPVAADGRNYWRVRVINEDGIAGEWSSVRSYAASIYSPINFAPHIAPDTDCTIDWEDVEDISNFQIQISSADDFSTLIVEDSNVPGSQYTVNLPVFGPYYYRVRSQIADGNCSNWSWAQKVFRINETKLTASNAGWYDSFGSSVAVSNDENVIVSGAYQADGTAQDSGSAYIYRKNGTSWEETPINASNGVTGDCFGKDVAVSSNGDVVFVGAYKANDTPGTLYAYRRESGIYTEYIINPPDGTNANSFAKSLECSSDGNTIFVGSMLDDDMGQDSGAVYIYQWNGTGWDESKITASDGTGNDWFGSAVTCTPDGSRFVTAATRAAVRKMYIYTWTGSSWSEEIIADPENINENDFGSSLAINQSGNVIIIGDNQFGLSGSPYGAVYIFRWNGSAWDNQQIIAPSFDRYPGLLFGVSVDISWDGTKVLIGAPGAIGKYGGSGSVYLYEYDGSEWSGHLIKTFVEMLNCNFGWDVSLKPDGNSFAAGADTESSSTYQAGALYYYELE